MQNEKFDVTKLPYKSVEFKNTSSLTDVVDEYGFLNRVQLYIAHYNEIPNSLSLTGIDSRKANAWFLKEYEAEIKKHYFREVGVILKKGIRPDDIFYLLDEDLIVFFSNGKSLVRFLFSKTAFSRIEELMEKLNKFKKREKRQRPYINLLTHSSAGFDTTQMELVKTKLKLEDNYNDDFLEVHKTIIKRLSNKKDKGIVLLYGKPGTGKTSYIRRLLTSVKKKVIFLPPNMAEQITNPSLMSFLMENANSIFVIEDAENIVLSRDLGGSSAVSALLNLADGVLSDCLNIQIVCSFNTDISKVDSALLRKGRLIAKYEFKELEIHKAQTLSYKLGFQTIINQPMTLTQIYNQEEREFKQISQRTKIGFK